MTPDYACESWTSGSELGPLRVLYGQQRKTKQHLQGMIHLAGRALQGRSDDFSSGNAYFSLLTAKKAQSGQLRLGHLTQVTTEEQYIVF